MEEGMDVWEGGEGGREGDGGQDGSAPLSFKILEDSAQGRWFGMSGLLNSIIIDPRLTTVHAQIPKQSALVWPWFGLGLGLA